MNKSKNLIAMSLGAAGAGAALMLLFDPADGRERRAWIGQKTVQVAKFTGRGMRTRVRDLENRAKDVAAEAGAGAMKAGELNDEILAERVRSKIGRASSYPRAIEVSAERGVVNLRGAVLRSERRRTIRCAESVRGVKTVRADELRTYSDEEKIPGFKPKAVHVPSERKTRQSSAARGFRVGIALMSAALGIYRAMKNSQRAGLPQEETANASESQAERPSPAYSTAAPIAPAS